ncbi:hypothetical protein E1B28_005295 [Marasmius oreades]|uniref:Uncharacterized protein n=1 Tax=Marasmius oreades TaxID=181124 RepID=A0A9P7V0G9_9AGAR|nr:uncharacterized protein E1B28_005295 [Marasmius oreades]KAG7097987.1 hypothetical protein E1B28_005295 [Marasmius oreades]
MADRTHRFTLVNDSKDFAFHLKPGPWEDCAWLSQALNIFHALGISLDKDLSICKLILPHIQLIQEIDGSQVACQRCKSVPPIYVFVLPLPLSCLPNHFWSHDENGQTHIPNETCKYLGLPTKLPIHVYSNYQYTWPKNSAKMYNQIHKWQMLRGFDPNTTDFAHYLAYPVYEVVHPESS